MMLNPKMSINSALKFLSSQPSKELKSVDDSFLVEEYTGGLLSRSFELDGLTFGLLLCAMVPGNPLGCLF